MVKIVITSMIASLSDTKIQGFLMAIELEKEKIIKKLKFHHFLKELETKFTPGSSNQRIK